MQRGISLVELLLVIAVIGSTVILLANIPNAILLINKSKHVSLAKEIAAKQIEDKRSINYANLVNDTSQIADTRIGLLPQGTGSVVISDCDLLICPNNEHIKKVIVTISWKDNNKIQNVILSTLIGEGGINQ